ncbi:Arc family DNA-binding protein [Paracoccus spongiarum]|uniref:Arc family DNA-binding protein n=1 Tax=Paracoccus spongiarum TaxID=3064387 RepID=A0ABT9JCP8_9RHOB|nr:Arc family DNA-binding protein [Paracoccus sp. 2205BS29-5]MDP5307582.1 Arc family DNA-binding protein [Paracoccus sp. 2205BS29-5]
MWLYASMTDRKPQDQDKFVLRLPDGMRNRLKMAAERNRRSMNAEIVDALDSHLLAMESYAKVIENSAVPDTLADEIADAVRQVTLKHLRGS